MPVERVASIASSAAKRFRRRVLRGSRRVVPFDARQRVGRELQTRLQGNRPGRGERVLLEHELLVSD